jgi:histidyl-tRNA synthetase
MKPEEWGANGLEIGLTETQLDGLKSVLGNYDLWKESEELRRVFAALEALGVKEYIKFEPSIMRGLLYYTSTVFEAFDLTGSVRRSILGGGRYDNLLEDVGGDPLPATGFAMGDVVIGIILREAGLLPGFNPTPAPVLVTVFDQSLMMKSLALACELRNAGINTITYAEPAKLPKQFKFADKMKMKVAIVIGPDEAEKGQAVVKDLTNGTQQTVGQDAVVNLVKKILGENAGN